MTRFSRYLVLMLLCVSLLLTACPAPMSDDDDSDAPIEQGAPTGDSEEDNDD